MRSLAAPVKSAVDKFKLLPEFLKVRGLVKQHIDSFNYFVNCEIKKIIHAKENECITFNSYPGLFIRFDDIYVGEPSMMLEFSEEKLTPHQCRLSDMTYAAPIKVDITYNNGTEKDQYQKGLTIGRMPIMLRSCRCVLSGRDEAELARLGECPLDPGGYFVVKGTEKVVLIQEQLSKNRIIIDTDKKGRLYLQVSTS
ncbi:DNA-directed RNA polymerase III subunit 2 [Asimina triloba]